MRAFAVLADEFGVPLMDETPKALADSPGGRLLLDLLELPDYPTPSKLLAIPELVSLANAALRRNLGGREALTLLAREVGLEGPLLLWLGRLETPQDELAWARELLDSLPELTKRPPEGGWDRFREHALERAKEAAQLAQGAQFRAWWGALLQETAVFERPKGGVALLTPTLASGRRFARVYLLRALTGAYSAGEREDYFVPEEARHELGEAHARFGLPKRFGGRDPLLLQELKTRADEMMISYPEADQRGPRVPELALTGGAQPLSALPAGSPLEAGQRFRFVAALTPVTRRGASVKQLSAFDRCAFRFWAERFTPRGSSWWRDLVRELRGLERLNGARLEALRRGYPDAAPWLGEVEATLTPLTFGYTLTGHGSGYEDGPHAYLDAIGRSGDEYRVYTFVEPGSVEDAAAAKRFAEQTGRLHELWAAAQLLEGGRGVRSPLPVAGAGPSGGSLRRRGAAAYTGDALTAGAGGASPHPLRGGRGDAQTGLRLPRVRGLRPLPRRYAVSSTVALVTDVHHGSDSEYIRGTLALPLLENALEEIAARRPALLVDLGDRVNDAEPELALAALAEVAACFSRLDVPRQHLLGNNDVTERREQETMLGGPLGNRSLERAGWQLVLLDTFDGSVEGELTPETLVWLERTLALNDLPAVVFSHQPLDGQPLPGNAFFGGNYAHQAHPRGHKAARRVLERSGKVKLAISGHAHWNHAVTVGETIYVTLAAVVPHVRDDEDEDGWYGLLTLGDTLRLEVCRCTSGCRVQVLTKPGERPT